MKMLLCLTVVVVLTASSVLAGEIVFPSDAPVASVTFPDDWQPQETDTGIDVISPDDAVYFAIDVSEAADLDKAVVAAQDYLKGKGVQVDTSTAKRMDGALNGMEFKTVEFDGRDEDGPVSISMGLLALSKDKSLVLTYWGTKGDQDNGSYQAVLKIVQSVKPAG